MGAGPEHLLRAGLDRRLRDAGHHLEVHIVEPPADAWRAEIGTAFALACAVASVAGTAVRAGAFPLVLSGNCGPAALGCIGGLGSTPAVLWFDAHGDFNTPETTVGGFLDGMALATLTGRCWTQLAAGIPGFAPVPESAVALLGARDLDPLEAEALAASQIRRVTVDDMRGDLPAALTALGTGRTTAYLHLDLDVLDPSEGRVNPYATPDGLRRADLEWAIATIGRTVPVRAASLTALDPGSDTDGKACENALALAVTLVDAAGRAPAARDS